MFEENLSNNPLQYFFFFFGNINEEKGISEYITICISQIKILGNISFFHLLKAKLLFRFLQI